LNELGPGEFFGEMALLDAAPRVASVTTVSDAQLFRLDQEVLYDVMSDYPEVARGIVRVISARLRDRLADIAELDRQLSELAQVPLV
jgi:CRP-like cAMP-binding protein